MNHRIIYIRDSNNNPVGCLAYASISPRGNRETIAYGISFLNPDVDEVSREGARRVAEGRLELALKGEERPNQQGRWGQLMCLGTNVHEKVRDLLSQLSSRTHDGQEIELHRNANKNAEMKVRLATQIGRMKRDKAA